MKIKFNEIDNIKLEKNKLFLLYGKNDALKRILINKIDFNEKSENIFNYDERDILHNPDEFFNEILTNSFFEKNKKIIINNSTDKIINIVKELLNKNLEEIIIIFTSELLEKKSKLRNLFEENKYLICVPVYPDTNETLLRIANSFFKEKKISISQSTINLLINRCNNERINLENELKKIEIFSTNKIISEEHILKLTNLSENFDLSNLVDSCLIKNQKKTTNILNENNFSSPDAIIILKVLSQKLKKILKLSKNYEKFKNLDKVINEAKPPIFWKDKDIIKQQINLWKTKEIKDLIFELNSIELQVKKNIDNSIQLITNFILEICTSKN